MRTAPHVSSHRRGHLDYPGILIHFRGLASVFQEKGSQGAGCAIAYGFEARLHRPGILHSDAKAKSQLKVLRRPQETASAMPVLVGPEAQTVKTCCCFKSGRSVAAMTIYSFPVVCSYHRDGCSCIGV